MWIAQRASIIRTRTMPFPTGGCRTGLTPKVNILSDEVKAKPAGDTNKGGCYWLRPGLALAAARNNQSPTMNDIARQLRAQIPSSTDPDRLERMAREIERGISPSRRPGQAHQGLEDAEGSAEAREEG
jgi:hypothetical protein